MTAASTGRASRAALALPRGRVATWSWEAWGALAITLAFLGIAWWWLTQDGGIPSTEPGAALNAALNERDLLATGDLLAPLTYDAIHPPLLQVVGAVGMLIGGLNVTAAVFAQDLFFVPLLALGCYHTGKLAAGPRAGLLAVAFALGAPLVAEQFHVYMVDAPEAALVAMAVWLILASERFSRLGVAALAGVAVGLGLETKQQFPFFLLGLLAVVLLRGGWRNWRGIAIFAALALAVGSPWYVAHLAEVLHLTRDAEAAAAAATIPPRFSLTNLGWYFWGALNTLLYAPLFALAAIGTGVALRRVLRRARDGIELELLAGMGVSWLALTITPIHTVRYMLPMIVYIAVLGTAWIVRLDGRGRTLATAALALAVTVSTLGASFGVGGRVRVMLTSEQVPDRAVYGVAAPRQVIFHADENFLVTGPRRHESVLDMFKALRRRGMVAVVWLPEQNDPRHYDHYGLDALAALARLGTLGSFNPQQLPPHTALLVRERAFGSAPPCVRLSDGTGIWVRVGRALSPTQPHYCPLRMPPLYGP
jgi:4-amino-4-deoxy-L-arabinose transferase-like glycosyltransferase